MRSFDAEDKWDVKELGRINAQAWQTELLKLNPDYVCWGPGEDCMWVKGDGWTSPITAESWSELENKGLDDLNEVVNFYFSVERASKDCTACARSGYAPEAKQVKDDFYDFSGTGRRWIDKLTMDEVEALVAHDRLASKWDGEKWIKPVVDDAFVDKVNEANRVGGIGDLKHDAINQGIAIEARCKRLGYVVSCPVCGGTGSVYTAPDAHVELTLWLLHPRKGASRGVRIERVEQGDLPEVFRFLRDAAERNAGRFAKVPVSQGRVSDGQGAPDARVAGARLEAPQGHREGSVSPQPSRREPLWGVWVSSTCDRDSDDGWLHDLNRREPWTGTEEQAKAHAAKLGALAWRQRYGHEARPMPTDPSSEADSRELRGYVVRGGDGGGTALFGYAWTSKGKYELLRAVGDGLGQLVVKRFPPTEDGRRRALLVAIAVGGTVKRVMKRVRRSGK